LSDLEATAHFGLSEKLASGSMSFDVEHKKGPGDGGVLSGPNKREGFPTGGYHAVILPTVSNLYARYSFEE